MTSLLQRLWQYLTGLPLPAPGQLLNAIVPVIDLRGATHQNVRRAVVATVAPAQDATLGTLTITAEAFYDIIFQWNLNTAVAGGRPIAVEVLDEGGGIIYSEQAYSSLLAGFRFDRILSLHLHMDWVVRIRVVAGFVAGEQVQGNIHLIERFVS